jgi:hypothetical protein
MALDPSIALGVRPLQVPDPMAQLAQVSQIQASQRQNEAAQRQNEIAQIQLEQLKQDRLEMQNFQSQLEKSGGNPDLDLLAKTMLKSPKYFEKGFELTKKLKEQKDYQAYLDRQVKPAGITMPMAAPAGATAPMNALAASAGVSPQPSVNALAARPTLADLQAQYREVSRFSAPGAKAEAEMLKDQIKQLQAVHVVPNVGLVSGSGQTIVASGMAPTEIKKLISERDLLPAGDPRRKVYDQAIADLGAANRNAEARLKFDQNKFAWEKANPGFELKEAEDGSIVGVNKRTLQAFPVTVGGAAPAAAPAGAGMPGARATAPEVAPTVGTPLRGKGTAMTESQSNATAYGMRMKEANAILDDLSKKGVLKGAVIESTPLIGGALGQALPSALGGTSAAQQQVNQAKSNFITAVLRKESGAVISDSEFDREDKKYFPQINDNASVIKQKENARKLAIKAIEVQAGPGAKSIQQLQPSAGGLTGASANDPLGLGIR